MKRTVKFLWWSIIFLIVYGVVFGMDLLEYFLPENTYYSPFMEMLGYSTLLVPGAILFIMVLMFVLFVITVIINRRNRIQNNINNS